MQLHKGYWISLAVPFKARPIRRTGRDPRHHLETAPWRPIVEAARLRLATFTVEIKELAEWFGVELCRVAVDECLPPL